MRSRAVGAVAAAWLDVRLDHARGPPQREGDQTGDLRREPARAPMSPVARAGVPHRSSRATSRMSRRPRPPVVTCFLLVGYRCGPTRKRTNAFSDGWGMVAQRWRRAEIRQKYFDRDRPRKRPYGLTLRSERSQLTFDDVAREHVREVRREVPRLVERRSRPVPLTVRRPAAARPEAE